MVGIKSDFQLKFKNLVKIIAKQAVSYGVKNIKTCETGRFAKQEKNETGRFMKHKIFRNGQLVLRKNEARFASSFAKYEAK
jgi:hypothetical protein